MLTARSLAVALTLGILAVLWTRQVELVQYTCQITESVPPIPALAALLLLTSLAAVRRRRAEEPPARRPLLSRPEILAVYAFLTVMPTMSSVGIIRRVLPAMSVLSYFGSAQNHFGELARDLPRWYAPRDADALREMYEGADPSRLGPLVPWDVWAGPLASWGGFLLVFFATLLCLALLLREHWTRVERLGYPIAAFSLDIADSAGTRSGRPPLLRDRVMWVGFACAVLLNAMNVWSALDPVVTAPGLWFGLGRFFTEYPLSVLGDIQISYRPELIGLLYLVPLDVLLSIWVFYLVLQAEKLAMTVGGLSVGAVPYQWEQSIGAYVVLGAFLLWSARRSIATALRRTEATEEGSSPSGARGALAGAIGGYVLLTGFCVAAGMAWWLAATYMAVLLLVAVVYARIRAETGAPMVWLFPIDQQHKALRDAFGLSRILAGGSTRSATVFTSLEFLSRGFFPTFMASQLEAVRIGEDCRAKRHEVVAVLLVAAAVGLAAGSWMHLSTYYEYGANTLEGGTVAGGPRVADTVAAFTNLSDNLASPPGRDATLVKAHFAGAGSVLLLMGLKTALLRFPLSPLGFAIASSYSMFLWFPALLVWAAKSAIVGYGGARLYRRLVPLFLGLALGHFFAAGVCLGTIGIWSTDISSRYMVHFG